MERTRIGFDRESVTPVMTVAPNRPIYGVVGGISLYMGERFSLGPNIFGYSREGALKVEIDRYRTSEGESWYGEVFTKRYRSEQITICSASGQSLQEVVTQLNLDLGQIRHALSDAP